MKEAYAKLFAKNLIFSGSYISAEILEEVLEVDKSSQEFVFKKLGLKERIKLENFFVSDRGCDDEGFRILESLEMADYSELYLQRNLHQIQKNAMIMNGHDISQLTDNQQKKHRFAQTQAVNAASALQQAMLSSVIL